MAAARPEFVVKTGPSTYRLKLRIQPGAKHDRPAGLYQDRLKVQISAPAVDNKANKALQKFIAELFGVKASCVDLESGHKSRNKNVSISVEAEPDWAAAASVE